MTTIKELNERIENILNSNLSKVHKRIYSDLLKEWITDKLAMIKTINDILRQDVTAFSSSRQYYRILDEIKQLGGESMTEEEEADFTRYWLGDEEAAGFTRYWLGDEEAADFTRYWLGDEEAGLEKDD